MEFLIKFVVSAVVMSTGVALILAWIAAVYILRDQHPLWAMALFFGVLILAAAAFLATQD